jgi:hypothetical protein
MNLLNLCELTLEVARPAEEIECRRAGVSEKFEERCGGRRGSKKGLKDGGELIGVLLVGGLRCAWSCGGVTETRGAVG